MAQEAEVQKQLQKWGLVAGGLVSLFLLNRWRQKRKVKRILKARARLKELQEKERKEKKGRAGRRARKKAQKKERSMLQQLVRFAVFQFLKKVISEQIKQMEVELGKGKLGKKLVEGAATEQA